MTQQEALTAAHDLINDRCPDSAIKVLQGHFWPICSVSGGKDSTDLYCRCVRVLGKNGFTAVFADTGHEHPVTVNYVKNLHRMAGGPEVEIVRADFAKVLEVKGMEPSGVPFLDMARWKASFPSSTRQFCTEHLKLRPIAKWLDTKWYMDLPPIMLQGVRAAESSRRAGYKPTGYHGMMRCHEAYPLLRMTEAEVFASLEYCGVPPNPLYTLGYTRVGCFPCIHARKSELARLPDWVWDKLIEWEQITGRTWFPPGVVAGDKSYLTSIDKVRTWCKTKHGGNVPDEDIEVGDPSSCMRGWGGCE